MDLILWRHAEAETGNDDLARRLTGKGKQQAQKAAAFLREKLPETAEVYVSQAVRSRETGTFLCAKPRVSAALNPDIDALTLPPLLARLPENGCTVWVGHQPWIGQTCAFLLNGGHGQMWSVKKGGFWWFKLQHTPHGIRAKLRLMLTPNDL